MYAYGLRNPWRFSFDPVTNKLWVGDVGQNAYEEIDTVQIGRNYGWHTMEGKHCYTPAAGCDTTGLVQPLWDYAHDANGGSCIIGGVVYRGKKIPSLYGKYVYGDYIAQRIWVLSIGEQGGVVNQLFGENVGPIVTFGVDADQELYFCTYGLSGAVYRIDQGIASVDNEKGSAPNDFRLDQNYPNPFNGETVIPFRIGSASHAVLAIFDELGRRVVTLIDREMEPGQYTVRWNAEHYASGVYSCRLTAGAESATRLIILQK